MTARTLTHFFSVPEQKPIVTFAEDGTVTWGQGVTAADCIALASTSGRAMGMAALALWHLTNPVGAKTMPSVINGGDGNDPGAAGQVTEELLPCPFCDGPAIMANPHGAFSRLAAVYCEACEIKGQTAPNASTAAALWNRRASPPQGDSGLVEAGNELAATIKANSAFFAAALPRRELAILMDDLHKWNVAALQSTAPARMGGKCIRCFDPDQIRKEQTNA